jgi:hypothetical protein
MLFGGSALIDCSALAQLDDLQTVFGCVDLSDMLVETPELVADRTSPASDKIRSARRGPRVAALATKRTFEVAV